MFGRPAARLGGATLPFPEKGFVLLALLAFADAGRLDRDTARELLWENAPSERRAGNLRQLLLRMNRVAAGLPVVETVDGVLRLVPDLRIDAVELFDAGAPTDAKVLGHASLLEGVAVDGQLFEDWLLDARRRVNERRVAVLRAALEDLDPDGPDRIALAERLVDCDPLDEAGYRILIAAHAQAGNEPAARRRWLECCSRLDKELGVRPGAETCALAARLGLEGGSAPARMGEAPPKADPLGVPTVVIMPPAMLPGNELLDRLGLVVLEEITLGLSQFGSFRVIAAHTSWQLAQADRNDRLGFESGRFDYAVTVGVGSSSSPLVASCRLTRLSTGEVLWSTRLAMQGEGLRGSVEEAVRRAVGSLAAAVERAEGRNSTVNADSTGYRMYLEGKQALGTTGLPSLRAARKWFKAAINRCDEFSAAFAGLSRTLSMEWLVRGMTDSALLGEALTAARQARACDPASGQAMREIGFANLYLRRHDESLDSFSQARLLTPYDADLLADEADALMHDGQPERAMEVMSSAKDLNPLPPDHYRWIEASIMYRLEDFQGAIRVLDPLSDSPATSRLLAASCAMAGDAAAARRHAAKLRENYPDFRVDCAWQILPDRRKSDTTQFIRGLRLAGLD